MTRRLRELDSPTAPLRERLRKVTLGSDEFEHDYAWDSSMDRSSSVSHPLVPYLSEFLPSPDESDFAALKTPRPSNEAVRRKQTCSCRFCVSFLVYALGFFYVIIDFA
jgi:hypothetical protein